MSDYYECWAIRVMKTAFFEWLNLGPMLERERQRASAKLQHRAHRANRKLSDLMRRIIKKLPYPKPPQQIDEEAVRRWNIKCMECFTEGLEGRPMPFFSSSRTMLASVNRAAGFVFLVSPVLVKVVETEPGFTAGTGLSDSWLSQPESASRAASSCISNLQPRERTVRPLASKRAVFSSISAFSCRIRAAYTASANWLARERRRIRHYSAFSSAVSPASSISTCVGHSLAAIPYLK